MPHLRVLCDQGTHCAACRAAGGDGPAWREAILAHYTVPDGYPDACPKGLPMGWVPEERCVRCGADWHALADCPIPPDYVATPANATGGGCGCDGSQTRDAGDRPA